MRRNHCVLRSYIVYVQVSWLFVLVSLNETKYLFLDSSILAF